MVTYSAPILEIGPAGLPVFLYVVVSCGLAHKGIASSRASAVLLCSVLYCNA